MLSSCVCPSVCHKLVSYRRDWTDKAGFDMKASFYCVVRKFGYLQNNGIFLCNSVPNFILDLKNFARVSRSCCQQSLETVEFVDHTYDGRRVARSTSVDRNALTALLRSGVGLLWTLFLQWCSGWQDFDWYSVSCSLSAVEELLGYSLYIGNVQTPGPLVFWLSSKSIVQHHLSIAQVLSQLCLPGFFIGPRRQLTVVYSWNVKAVFGQKNLVPSK